MGAGKTTVGKKLARLMRMDFIDTDHLLEKKTGVSVSHIFEVEGESGFRDRETRVLEEVSNGSPAVISTGGGAFLTYLEGKPLPAITALAQESN